MERVREEPRLDAQGADEWANVDGEEEGEASHKARGGEEGSARDSGFWIRGISKRSVGGIRDTHHWTETWRGGNPN